LTAIQPVGLIVDDFGHNGPIGITENEIKYELTTLFINASVELGMKRNPTYNNGQNQGKPNGTTRLGDS